MSLFLRRLALVLAALVFAACGSGGDDFRTDLQYSSLDPMEPTAMTWHTWVLADPADVLPPPPPGPAETADELAALVAWEASRTPMVLANIDEWNLGTCRAWNALARQLVVSRGTPPPRAARAYALLAVAMHDSMVASFHAKYTYLRARPSAHVGAPTVFGVEPDSPSYVSERAAMSAAAAEVLGYLFPLDTATIAALLATALDSETFAGIHFPSDVTAGQNLGAAVGDWVVAHAMVDGADVANIGTHTPDGMPYTPAAVPGTAQWTPTPTGFAAALLPGWGAVATWSIADGSEYVLPAAPAYDSAQWIAMVAEVYDISQNLTPERIASANFWADGPGTATPPGHWNAIAVQAGIDEGLNECRMARMLAMLGVAQSDAFVACWWNKYFHDLVRPITEVRLRFDVGWNTVVGTPPFPAYPSGHSSTSGAASQTLAFVFPDRAIEMTTMGTDAMNSRLYGGIHYTIDNNGGFDLGRAIANRVLSIVAGDDLAQ